jgi:polar amino acid transport system substrate-binding protein
MLAGMKARGSLEGARRWLALALLLCAGMAVAAPPVPARLRLHFVTEPFPPYSYEQQGQAAGPMVDVLNAACAELKWQCRVEILPWRRALSMAQRHEVDGIFSIVDTPERRAYFRLTVPMIDARYTLFARAGDDFQLRGDLKALRGRTIGAYGPSNTVLALDDLVEGIGAVKTEIESDNLTVLRKLSAGRYGPQGLALLNESVALALMRDEKIPGLQAAGTVKSFAYSFGLSRQRVREQDFRAFNAALRRLCRSGRSAELIKPYAVPASACTRS